MPGSSNSYSSGRVGVDGINVVEVVVFCQEFHQKDVEHKPDAHLDCLTTVEHTTFQTDDGIVCVSTWTVISTCAASLSATWATEIHHDQVGLISLKKAHKEGSNLKSSSRIWLACVRPANSIIILSRQFWRKADHRSVSGVASTTPRI